MIPENIPWTWIASFLLQVASTFAGAIAYYFKMRELIFTLDRRTESRMMELHTENVRDIAELKAQIEILKKGVGPVAEWWEEREERRFDRRKAGKKR